VREVDYIKEEHVPFIQNMLVKQQTTCTCKFLAKCLNTKINNFAKFVECQPKGVRGVDYTK
jgi:hypothetical protein